MATAVVGEDQADVEFGEIVAWYREELSRPAEFPWAGSEWTPTLLGPTWQTTPDGHWLLPDASIGWAALGWAGSRLQLRRGEPWRFTLEQARWLLWWYALDEAGRFLFRDGVLQRLKGWGKDPIGAVLALIEAFGPARFLEWEGDDPVATDVDQAWIQLAAVSLEQTKNTTRLFPSLLPDATRDEYRIRVGKELIYGLGDERMIQAVTSSPATLEGARATFTLKNEPHHWLANNEGHAMADVIERNATKSPDGAARTLSITNAYEPGEDSVAERDREAYELASAGGSLTTGILYDSVEAPPEAPLTAEAAPSVVAAIRGDALWLDVDRIVQSILDTRNPPSRSRRFWFNQIVAAEDAWADPQEVDLCRAELPVAKGEQVVLFFDGSKSDDASGLVGCRVSDGHGFTLGMWQRPPKGRDSGWLAPIGEIDVTVSMAFDEFDVVAFFADPSHAEDDTTGERYWDAQVDEWHARWKDQLSLWAQPGKHSVNWDMSSPQRTAEFTAACERTLADIEASAALAAAKRPPSLTWDGDPRLRRHILNARRAPNRYGVSIRKEHRDSQRKIDLAVCWIGARMIRRRVDLGEGRRRRTGNVW